MKKYRVIDWIDAEDHWEIVHEVDMEVQPAPGEMIVVVSSVEGLGRGDIIDGNGNLFRKHEAPLPPYGSMIELLTSKKQDAANLVSVFTKDSQEANTIVATINTNISNIQTSIAEHQDNGWSGKPDTENSNPALANKTPLQQIEYYQSELVLATENATQLSNLLAQKQQELEELETKLTEWTEFKQKWDAENLN